MVELPPSRAGFGPNLSLAVPGRARGKLWRLSDDHLEAEAAYLRARFWRFGEDPAQEGQSHKLWGRGLEAQARRKPVAFMPLGLSARGSSC